MTSLGVQLSSYRVNLGLSTVSILLWSLLHVLQMFALYLTCFGHVLESISFLTHIYCTLHSPHVSLASILYSSGSILMFSFFLSYCFLKDAIYFLWSLGIYSSRYRYVSLYFTNWWFLSFFLKSLPKLQSEPSLES